MMGYYLLFEKTYYEEIDSNFLSKDTHLTGKLILPKLKKESYPVLIFIHGDGAMPYDAYGYYHSLWNNLAKNGIASYSWNKAGVDTSSGNWITQSMDDRNDLISKWILNNI